MQPVGTLLLETLRDLGRNLWDPIGLRETHYPRNEYDVYLLALAGLLRRGATTAEAVDYLVGVTTEALGLAPGLGERTNEGVWVAAEQKT